MYSRYTSSPRDKGYRIPEHYSGCAFAAPQKEDLPHEAETAHPVPLPKTKISPSYAEASAQAFAAQPSPAAPPPSSFSVSTAEKAPTEHLERATRESDCQKPPKEPPTSGVLEQLLSHIGGGLPFANGIDFDSLLLLGLILLLAGDGGDTELLLLLTLLLFCA